MSRRGIPEISAGSMADIAFLLLIFFLVTQTMDRESGQMRLLPEISENQQDKVNEKNVIEILLNDENKVLFEGELKEISEISSLIQEMILNSNQRRDWPSTFEVDYTELKALVEKAKANLEKAKPANKRKKRKDLKNAKLRVKSYEIFGPDFKKSAHVISLQATKGSDYKHYIELSDQILSAYKTLKNKLAKKYWGTSWINSTSEQRKMLDLVYPKNISEAQTVDGGNN